MEKSNGNRLQFSTPEKTTIRSVFHSYIYNNKMSSPRPINRNIIPIVNKFTTLKHLTTPHKIKKIRSTIYNYRRLANNL